MPVRGYICRLDGHGLTARARGMRPAARATITMTIITTTGSPGGGTDMV